MFSKILKRSFFLPFPQKLLWLLPCGVLGALFFLGAFLASGADLQARHSTYSFYQSHAVAYQSAYRPSAPNDTSSWWPRQDMAVQQLDNQEFVRGFTRRTELTAYLIHNKERIPVNLILVEDTDNAVFPAAVQPDGFFPENTITMGIGLSAKHSINERTVLSVAVPSLGTVFTNQRVEKIYNLREAALQNYTVFMHRRTAAPILGEAMRAYHIRFSASPFIRLLSSNTQPLVPNSRFEAGSDSISHALNLLLRLKSLLFEGYLVVNFLAGILYAYALCRFSAKNEKRCLQYCSRNGFSMPSLHFPLFAEYLQAAVILGGTAAILAFSFEILPFEYLIFSPYTGLYPEFALKVSQGIAPVVDYPFLINSLPLGVLVFILTAAGARMLFRSFEVKRRAMGSIITLVFLSALFSYGISQPLVRLAYAQNARDNLLREHFFGDYSIKHKYGDQALSLKAAPEAFILNKDITDRLQAEGFLTYQKLEAFGEIIQEIEINEDVTVTNRLSVRFIGLRGKAPPELQNLVDAIESNQVVVGRTVQETFPEMGVLPFYIYGQASNISVSLPVSSAENFDLPFYNGCVFINIDTLAAYLGVPVGSGSSLLVYGKGASQYLTNLANPNLLMTPFKKQKALWTGLEKPAFLIRWCIFLAGISGVVLLIVGCLTAAAVSKKENFVYSRLWKADRMSSSAYFTAAFAVLTGGFLSALSLIPGLLTLGPLPTELILDPYTPALLALRVDAAVVLLAPLAITLLLAAGYGLLILSQKSYYQEVLLNLDLLDTEENTIP